MPKKLTTTLAAALTAAALAGSAFAGPIEDAVVEYSRGDYATALRFFRPMAEQGDARAQFGLASMYLEGKGVPQDYGKALKWFRGAAAKGFAGAQYYLGVRYERG
jgi:hypothetical protein